MAKTSKYIFVGSIITTIASFFLISFNKYFLYPLVFGGISIWFSLLFMVFATSRHNNQTYQKIIRTEFRTLMNNKDYNKAFDLLNKSEVYVNSRYRYHQTIDDIGKKHDGYVGYNIEYRIRNNCYIELFLRSKNYSNGINFIDSLLPHIKNEHLFDKYLFQLLSKDKSSELTFADIMAYANDYYRGKTIRVNKYFYNNEEVELESYIKELLDDVKNQK